MAGRKRTAPRRRGLALARRLARALRLKALLLFVLRWPLLRRTVRAGWRRLPERHRTRIRPYLPQPALVPVVKAPVAGRPYQPPPPVSRYDAWLEVNEPNARRTRLLLEELDRVEEPPLISVVMPVFDPPVELLDRAIRSVADQIYPHWELCVADDASSDPHVARLLADWASRDDRIKLLRRPENGHISAATNSAAALAGGEYLAFVDHDDELEPDALAEVALRIAADPSLDVLYTDDDQIDVDGRRFSPQFKPDWSPELLTSYMYLAHLLVVRRSLFEDV